MKAIDPHAAALLVSVSTLPAKERQAFVEGLNDYLYASRWEQKKIISGWTRDIEQGKSTAWDDENDRLPLTCEETGQDRPMESAREMHAPSGTERGANTLA
jgi:hypothetical protein